MKIEYKQRMLHVIYVVVIGLSCFFQSAQGGQDGLHTGQPGGQPVGDVNALVQQLFTGLGQQREGVQQDFNRLSGLMRDAQANSRTTDGQIRDLNDRIQDLQGQLTTAQAQLNKAKDDLVKEQEGIRDAEFEARKKLIKEMDDKVQTFGDALKAGNKALEELLKQGKTVAVELTPESRAALEQLAGTADELKTVLSKSPLEKGLGRLFSTASDLVKDPSTMVKGFLLAGGLVMSMKMGSYGMEKLRTALDKPPLVKETNIRTIMDSVLKRPLPKPENLKDLVYSPELQKKLAMILSMTKKARVLNEEYAHFMLFGPPGTGKTAFAKVLAQQSGMKYAIIAGSDFITLPIGQAVLELKRIFEWAGNSKQALMIVIDEAEAALMSREDPSCTELQRNLVTTFLNYVQKPSSKSFLIALLSNLPHKLDIAVRDRMGKKLEVPLPGLRERRIIFEKYVKKEILARRSHTIDPKITEDIAREDSKLGQMMQGLSGRAIEDAVKEMRRQATFEGSKVLTYELAEKIIKEQLEAERMASERYDVNKIKQDALKMNTTPKMNTSAQTHASAAAA